MPIFAIVAAGLALLAIFELRGNSTAIAPVVYAPPQPMPGAPTGGLVSPYGGGSMVDELAPAAINDGVKLLQSTSQHLGSAAAAVPVIGMIAAAAQTLLASHTLRLQNATSENAAVAKILPNFQADFVAIARAGGYSRAYRMQQCDQLNAQTMAYLKSHVGTPQVAAIPTLGGTKVGTAWTGSPSGCPGSDVPKTESGAHPCNSSCTVGCCIYYNYLEPAIDCLKKRIAKGGNQAAGVPKIPGNKYGFPVFPGFTVQIIPSAS